MEFLIDIKERKASSALQITHGHGSGGPGGARSSAV